MPQSLVKNYIHIIFSTKNREDTIKKEDKERVFKYMAGIVNKYECETICIGGTQNHIHALINLSKNYSLKQILQFMKGNTSRWLNHDMGYTDFDWQDGYAGFSVSQSKLTTVVNYIKNQEAHHKEQTFKEEVLEFLDKYQMKYDEKYLWD